MLCGLARDERVLVVLEDLHWATPDLLEVASTLVSDGCRSQGQLAYLGISRPELPGLPAWLLRTGTQRIDLDPLGEQSAAELLVSVLGTDAAPELAGQVFDASKGNPLFVKELAIALREAGPADARAAVAAHPRLAPGAGRGPARPAGPLDQAGPVPGRRRRQVVLARRPGRHGPAGRRRARRRPGPAGRDGPDRAAARAPGRRPGALRLPPRPVPGRRLRHPAQGRPVRAPPPAGRLAGQHPGEEPSLPEVVAYHLVQAVRLAGEVRAPTTEDRELAARAVAACQRAARRLRDQEALARPPWCSTTPSGWPAWPGPAPRSRPSCAWSGARSGAPPATCRAPWPTLGRPPARRRPAVRARAWTELSNLHGMLRPVRASRRPPPTTPSSRRPRPATRPSSPRRPGPRRTSPIWPATWPGPGACSTRRSSRPAGPARPSWSSSCGPPCCRCACTWPPRWTELRAEALGLAADARSAGRRSAEAAAQVTLGEVAWLQDDLDTAEQPLRRGQPAQPRGRLHPQAAVVAARPDPGGDRPRPAGGGPAAGPGGDRAHHPARRHRRRRGRAAPGRGLPGRRRPWRGGRGRGPRLGGAPGGRRVLPGQAPADRGQAGRRLRRPGGGGGPARAVPGRAGGDRPPPRPAPLAGRPGVGPAPGRPGRRGRGGRQAGPRPGDHHGRPRPGPPPGRGRGAGAGWLRPGGEMGR